MNRINKLTKALAILAIFNAGFESSAQCGDYTLVVSAQTVASGEAFDIDWSAFSPANTWGDWVEIYTNGDPAYQISRFSINGTHSGKITTSLFTNGNYTVQYFQHTGVAMTPPVTLVVATDASSYDISVDPNPISSGNWLTVNWSVAPKLDTTRDSIGCFRIVGSSYQLIRSVLVYGEHQGTAYFFMDHAGYYSFFYLKLNSVDLEITAPLNVTVLPKPAELNFARGFGGKPVLSWQSATDTVYTVKCSTNLLKPRTEWASITNLVGTGNVIKISPVSTNPTYFLLTEQIR